MKKVSFMIFVLSLISLLSIEVNAQEPKEEIKAVTKELQKEKEEIKLSELPVAVTKALGEQFAEYTAEKAYKGKKADKAVYLVKLSKDGETKKVWISAEGKVIERKKKAQNQ